MLDGAGMCVPIVDAMNEPALVAICLACGCADFELIGEDDDFELAEGTRGVINVTGDGRLYNPDGALVCFDCEEPLALPQDSTIPDGIGEIEMDLLKTPELPSGLPD